MLGRFVINFSLPALLFRAISQRSIGEVLNGPYLLAYTVGSLVVLLGGVFVARRLRGKSMAVAAIRGLGMAGANSGFVGYPIVLQLLGPPAGVALALTMMVENLLIIPLALAMADSASGSGLRWHQALAQSARGLLRNPMILSIVAGFVFALAGIELPEVRHAHDPDRRQLGAARWRCSSSAGRWSACVCRACAATLPWWRPASCCCIPWRCWRCC